MNINEIDDVDVADALEDVNWYSLTETEAVGFGVTMSLYRDALVDAEIARKLYFTKVVTLIFISLMSLFGFVIGIAFEHILIAIFVATFGNTCLKFLYLRAQKKFVMLHKVSALEEIDELARNHPAEKIKNLETTPIE